MSSDQTFYLEAIKLLVPVAAAFIAYLTLRQTQAVSTKLSVVHKQIDGQQDLLIATVKKAAHSEGVAEGVAAAAATNGAPPARGPDAQTRKDDH